MPRRLQKRLPEGHDHKTLVNSDHIWGVFLVSFSCPLRFLLRGSGFVFGAVLAAPSVPQGYLVGLFGVLLRAARGAQKGPPYRRDSLFLGSLWGPLGCPVGSRAVSSLFLAPRGLLSGMRPSDSSLVDPAYLQTVACRDKGLGGLASIPGITLVGPGLP